MGGGTDLLTAARPRHPAGRRRSSTCAALGLAGIEPDGDGLRIGATTTVCRRRARRRASRERYAGLARRPRAVGVAAAARDGHGRRQPLPAGALLVLPPSRPARAGCAAATPATPRSATTASTASSPATASRSRPSDLAAALLALDARVETSSRREAFPLAELYRRPTDDRRSTLDARAGRVRDRRRGCRRRRTPAPTPGPASAPPGASRWPASPPPGSARRSGWRRSASANLPRLLDPDGSAGGPARASR